LAQVNVIRLAELRESPLSVDEVRAAVIDPAAAPFAGAERLSATSTSGTTGAAVSTRPADSWPRESSAT